MTNPDSPTARLPRLPTFKTHAQLLERAKLAFLSRKVGEEATDEDFNILTSLLEKEDLHLLQRAWAHDLLSKIHAWRYERLEHGRAKFHSEEAMKCYRELIKHKERGAGGLLDGAKAWNFMLTQLDLVFAAEKSNSGEKLGEKGGKR